MCGICGAIGFQEAEYIVKRMTHAMMHRGPDSDGYLVDGPVAIGMRRLKIIDLETGDQPVFNEDRTIAVVFNGEIYNFPALHKELVRLGHRFATHSDTETIIHAYEEWGRGCLERLRGMFAFAIYDRRTSAIAGTDGSGTILLARDRLGIKPLYYQQDGDRFLFASEVRALLASEQVERRVSTAGLYTYLAMGSVQEPLTMVETIYSVPPASWVQLTWRNTQHQVTRGTYWRPPSGEPTEPSSDQIREWLTDAVSSHLISDVPLGAFLSGGLDSGAIVALGSQSMQRPMNTFTLAFDNWPSDERGLAGLTAARWNAHHQVRIISEAEVLRELPHAISAMDQPTSDGVNSWYVSREARHAGLTVALSGVGGDELFAGYRSFHLMPRLKRAPGNWQWLAKLPGWNTGWPILPGSPDMQRKTAAYLAGQTPFRHPYFAVRGLFTAHQIRQLLQTPLDPTQSDNIDPLQPWLDSVEAQLELAGHYDAIGEVSWLELSQYTLSTLLRDSDMMSMAHSLEVRVPFVDHKLVEQLLLVKGARKLANDRPKPLLTEALRGCLPTQVTSSAKRTFTFPFETWLREGLAQTIAQSLQKPIEGQSALFQQDYINLVWRDFEHGQTNWARPWALYVVREWIQKHLC